MTAFQIETSEQFRRTLQALAETGRLIAKEERYSLDLQKPDYLAFLRGHADKLNKAIDEFKAVLWRH